MGEKSAPGEKISFIPSSLQKLSRFVVKFPLEDVAGKLKMVPTDSDFIQEARMLGISFGD